MMLTKKDLALVAATVFECGLAGGYSEAEILAFAKQQAPSKDPAWFGRLPKRPTEGGGELQHDTRH